MRNREAYNGMSHFLGISLLMAFILPHTSTILMMANPIICIIFELSKGKDGYNHFKWNYIMWIPLAFTLIVNFAQDVTTKSIISCIVILLYVFCFPIVKGKKVPVIYFYLILAVIVISQMAYILNISFLTNFIDNLYPMSELEDYVYSKMQSNITVHNYFDFRQGGIYRNSNNCARALTMLMAAFIILNKEKDLKHILPFSVICYYAVLLTGSRTGFVVASVIAMGYLYYDKRIPSFWKFIFVGTAVIAFLVIIFRGSETLRGLNVAEGMNDSADQKMATFSYYLNTETSPFRFLFGYLDFSRFQTPGGYIMKKFDADYGEMIFCYGFVGFISTLIYLYKIFKKLEGVERIFFAVVLWMFTSAIVTSYRAFFMFMLLLSIVYSNRNNRAISN